MSMTQDVRGNTLLHYVLNPYFTMIPHHETMTYDDINTFRYQTMDWLLNQGADPNVQNEDGLTALRLAFIEGYGHKFYKRLFKAGTDPNIADVGGFTVLSSAHPDDVALLVAHGIDINHQCHIGNTVLHDAVGNNEPEFAKALIEHGADIYIKNKYGRTPKDYASFEWLSQGTGTIPEEWMEIFLCMQYAE
jgi:ankyrin repeat protein